MHSQKKSIDSANNFHKNAYIGAGTGLFRILLS